MARQFVLRAAALCCLPALVLAAGSLTAQAIPPLAGDDVVSVRVRFGITDTETQTWDGSVEATGGEVLAVRNWSVHPTETVDGLAWTMATREGMNYPRRVYQWEDPLGTVTYLHQPGIVVDVAGGGGTRLAFTTPRGDFDLRPADLDVDEELSFLDGAVLADRVAPAEPLSSPDDENDFATLASGENGEVWAAWTAYRDGGVSIMARRFDGSTWQPAVPVTDEPGDRLMPKLGRDGQGRPWLVWSEQVDANFDLYGRYLEDADTGDWSATERLTSAPQADIEHELVTDSSGNLWLVWQGFRDGRSDILARRHDGSGWSAEETVSASPANDWTPAVAACGDGSVYVAWDTYDQGNYDILLRRFLRRALGRHGPGRRHAEVRGPRLDRLRSAEPTLGGLERERLPVGQGLGLRDLQGSHPYLRVALPGGRGVGRRPLAGSRSRRERSCSNRNSPSTSRASTTCPCSRPTPTAGCGCSSATARSGRATRRTSRRPTARSGSSTAPPTVGGAWTRPLHLPFSRGRQDVRWELASDGRGNLFAAWPTDNRDSEEYLFDHSSINAAKLPALTGEATPPRLVDTGRARIPHLPGPPQRGRRRGPHPGLHDRVGGPHLQDLPRPTPTATRSSRTTA